VKRKIKNYSINPRKVPKRRWLFPVIAILVVLALLAAGGLYFTRSKNATNKKPVESPTINYNPPTKEEQAAGNAQKDNTEKSDKPAPVPVVNNKKSVQPTISYAKQNGSSIEIDAFVNGVAEDGGSCTLTAKLGTSTVTKQANGILNASNTSCPAFTIARSEFSTAGSWSVTVTYKSSTAEGTSAATNLEIK
jgi:hypothetical protein